MTAKPAPLEVWVTLPDDNVRHVWAPEGSTNPDDEIFVGPEWYADNGTPVDAETGDDMCYVRTEVRSHAR
jgi:hypothetical protein